MNKKKCYYGSVKLDNDLNVHSKYRVMKVQHFFCQESSFKIAVIAVISGLIYKLGEKVCIVLTLSASY